MNNLTFKILYFLTLLSTFTAVNAEIRLNNFWVVAAPSVATFTAIYGEIINTGDRADTLISVSTEQNSVMVHKTEIQNGMAKMLHQKQVTIEAQSSLVFKPMSYHLMVKNTDIKSDKTPMSLAITFTFKHAGVMKIIAPIRDPWM